MAKQETAGIYTNPLFRVQVEIIDRLPAGQSCRTVLYQPRELTDEEIMKWHDEQRARFNTRLKEQTLDKLDNFPDNPQE